MTKGYLNLDEEQQIKIYWNDIFLMLRNFKINPNPQDFWIRGTEIASVIKQILKEYFA